MDEKETKRTVFWSKPLKSSMMKFIGKRLCNYKNHKEIEGIPHFLYEK